VFTIHLPPLRERAEDILPLASHFLKKHTPEEKPVPRLAPPAASALLAYSWPGNVRELENTMIRAIHLRCTEQIECEDPGLSLPSVPAAPSSSLRTDGKHSYQVLKRRVLEAFEKDYLRHLMASHGGNVTQAAQAAGKDRRSLGKLLKKHGIDPSAFRPVQQNTSC
jgi:DNA-binding NtrC family response regulator